MQFKQKHRNYIPLVYNELLEKSTYDGMRGAGRAWPPGLPCGRGGAPPPPGLLGMAGAGLALVGAGGGPRPAPAGAPADPNEPCN